MDLLKMSINKSKMYKRIKIGILSIKIDTAIFIARLPQIKLKKAIKKIEDILVHSSNLISYLNI